MQQSKSLTVLTAVAPHLAEHLDATAESVKRLRYTLASINWSLRWIVVVDGPGSVIAPGADLTVRPERHAGVSTSRNYGLGFVDSEWVYSLDGDDMVNPEGFLEALGDPVLESVGWLVGDLEYIESPVTFSPFLQSRPLLVSRGQLVYAKTYPGHYNGNNMMARTDLLLRAGGWPGLRVDEDGTMLVRLSDLADGVISKHVLLHRRLWEGQTTRTPTHIDYLLSGQFEYRVQAARLKASGRPVPRAQTRHVDFGDAIVEVTGWPDRDAISETPSS